MKSSEVDRSLENGFDLDRKAVSSPAVNKQVSAMNLGANNKNHSAGKGNCVGENSIKYDFGNITSDLNEENSVSSDSQSLSNSLLPSNMDRRGETLE